MVTGVGSENMNHSAFRKVKNHTSCLFQSFMIMESLQILAGLDTAAATTFYPSAFLVFATQT